jgi:hypothetical protein
VGLKGTVLKEPIYPNSVCWPLLLFLSGISSIAKTLNSSPSSYETDIHTQSPRERIRNARCQYTRIGSDE